ncbi:hypothetical protein [Corynebacterium lipophiloflavum]|uniref:Uncharacterized protein n=1 Tax=Corynebacterium lipophiloflavum (strain ATCC 700352 / DSM 44291 / CCUG 37336 / JCM 10383 / DMMZ 1944) TaxID=525263 RepID=C0XRB4_CORLD|nr:hypothetical protein [Corynebacterium lipophiloflavum]EEI17248.1 hypothetical protein HMPREF0298_0984 [Corynebacterium lipophiloflavum DSM 44291]
MSSRIATPFDPEIWDPIIDAITSVFGPLAQLSAPMSALASSTFGLL